ncbi:hypothetical protein V6N12_013064 [Hibiscus sabdariffa]|uniref:Uncharacterized protein n=1 Tax=Hibiscus sabdariffa TaxID=183260 RepID=A0ABR2EHR0_9ROSI
MGSCFSINVIVSFSASDSVEFAEASLFAASWDVVMALLPVAISAHAFAVTPARAWCVGIKGFSSHCSPTSCLRISVPFGMLSMTDVDPPQFIMRSSIFTSLASMDLFRFCISSSNLSKLVVKDDKGDASARRQRVLPGRIILAAGQFAGLAWRKIFGLGGKIWAGRNMPDFAQICHGGKSPARGVGGKSSAWAGKSGLAGNMTDSAQLCHGRFTNSAPVDAIVAALAGSECHQPGTASVQLPIWH